MYEIQDIEKEGERIGMQIEGSKALRRCTMLGPTDGSLPIN
jgi:hypothetical protein